MYLLLLPIVFAAELALPDVLPNLGGPTGRCAGGGALLLIVVQIVVAVLHEKGVDVPYLAPLLRRLGNKNPNPPAPTPPKVA